MRTYGIVRLTNEPTIVNRDDEKKCAARFSVASRKSFVRDGEPDSDFYNCVCFGKLALHVAEHITKGMRIFIDGEIHNNNYQDANGVTHYREQIYIEKLDFADGKKSSTASPE